MIVVAVVDVDADATGVDGQVVRADDPRQDDGGGDDRRAEQDANSFPGLHRLIS
jgi:hypothetical protein